ncbi:hypothetical protein JZ751_024899 [Albula glossodonta]|uniref:Uncharacterized protein n=1 Tax=Albula glossodonta TaxID=121402 RepID=A0A8T2PFV8_9TELE|nr:hypothetical protein JZ751_024899 [Albula glossodonta]
MLGVAWRGVRGVPGTDFVKYQKYRISSPGAFGRRFETSWADFLFERGVAAICSACSSGLQNTRTHHGRHYSGPILYLNKALLMPGLILTKPPEPAP